MARPRLFTFTPEELKKEIEKYLKKCSADDVLPDESGMILFLGIRQNEYDRMKEKPEYDAALEYAYLSRRSWLERKMVMDRSAAAGCKYALEQMHNGGYSDKVKVETKQKNVNVHLDVMGEEKEWSM